MLVLISSHCRATMAGTNGNSPPGWLKKGALSDVYYPDRQGWRLYSRALVETTGTRTGHMSTPSGND
jgi:hypothetical protein